MKKGPIWVAHPCIAYILEYPSLRALFHAMALKALETSVVYSVERKYGVTFLTIRFSLGQMLCIVDPPTVTLFYLNFRKLRVFPTTINPFCFHSGKWCVLHSKTYLPCKVVNSFQMVSPPSPNRSIDTDHSAWLRSKLNLSCIMCLSK